MDNELDYFCPNNHVEQKEHIYFAISAIISGLIYILLIIKGGFGIIPDLLILLVIILCLKMIQGAALAQLKQNAIKITPEQFSLIYNKASEFSEKLKLKKIPEIYMFQSSGALNALATRFLFKNYVILYSDIMELAYKEGEDAVAFIVAHELAHIHRNHLLKYALTAPIIFIPFLRNAFSRACETTCDNIATALVPNNSLEGLLVLLAGKELYKKVNVKEFLLNADKEYNHSAWLGEIKATHPYLSRRLYNIAKRTNRDFVQGLPKEMFKLSIFQYIILGFSQFIIWVIIIALIVALIVADNEKSKYKKHNHNNQTQLNDYSYN